MYTTASTNDTIYVKYHSIYYYHYRSIIVTEKIGSEQNLIKFIAHRFFGYIIGRDSNIASLEADPNTVIYGDHCYSKEQNIGINYQYYYADKRSIDINNYLDDAWDYFLKNILNENWVKNEHLIKPFIKVYKGTFRRAPVEGIHNYNGGPRIRSRHIRQLKAMYANPEYKGFNRGSKKDLPDGWWDDWTRSVERNWKSQTKHRHQWQK
jgi:hypothetical protein